MANSCDIYTQSYNMKQYRNTTFETIQKTEKIKKNY